MKTKITLLCFLLLMSFASKAQNYVTIPDANFVAYLQANYSSCMNGNQMDTTCSSIQNETDVDVSNMNISDLTGLKYFTSLINLGCNYNLLSSLTCLPDSLQQLNCNYNNLSSLPSLPANLSHLYCQNNQLTSLPSLPINLQILYCGPNQLSYLPSLPVGLQVLYCQNNQLSSLPNLPPNLQWLECDSNQIINLPILPNNLYFFSCVYNNLTTLPSLPSYIKYLSCNDNQITSLPSLPDSIQSLNCSLNFLTILPSLPPNLQDLECGNNQLMNLPNLPANLQVLGCPNNYLSTLPSLPNTLTGIGCQNNNISCFPSFPSNLTFIDISGNPFTCLPNYIPVMNPLTLDYPLCVDGDFFHNPNGCESAEGILGYSYNDNNTNCIKDTSDLSLINIPFKLYDINNNLLSQTCSAINGIYNFSDSIGIYTVKIDTAGLPFTAQCTNLELDSTVTLTYNNPLAESVNFAIKCKLGFDIGVQSISALGSIFPGQQHKLGILAGDMNQWYNLHCASGINGQIQVIVTGPVTYNGISSGTLTPSVAGNVFTYTIADFGIVNMQDFGLLFTTDTTAQAGDQICVNVTVTLTNGDNNLSNNNYQFCYLISNSYDPNLKEVYPVNVLPGYQDWFTYTIHFQNTGNAPAMNIRLVDTLSNNLDLETFQLINYSHQNTVSLQNKVLTFRFPNIQLPDSASNSEGSKGFVQYRIKPKPNLPLGTQIQNTANIYFDYNAPIVTNTTINEYTQTASINKIVTNASLSVYPNPGNGHLTLTLSKGEGTVEIYNVLGEKIYQSEIKNPKSEIDISQQPNGIYIVRVQGNKQSFSQRLVKQ